MESEKRHRSLKLANGKSVQVMDCGDYVEITPNEIFLDIKGFRMSQGVSLPAMGRGEDDRNCGCLTFPGIVYKIPKNLRQLDMAERKKVINQIRFEKMRKLFLYFLIGFNEALTRAGHPALGIDDFKKMIEESKEEDEVDKLCEEIKKM